METISRLHLGSGFYHWPGFINVDTQGNPDIKCDFINDELKVEKVDEIHSIHLFEHLPRKEVEKILGRWRDLLKPNGLLVMEMPSVDKIAQLIVDGAKNQRLTTMGLYGDPNDPKPFMMHEWGYQEWELEAILTKCGFTDIVFPEPVYHMAQRDLRVECRRIG